MNWLKNAAEKFMERDFHAKACGDSPEGSEKRCELFKGHVGLHQFTKSDLMTVKWR